MKNSRESILLMPGNKIGTDSFIKVWNGEFDVDNFNLKYDDILDKLMILNNRKRDDIKNVIVTYGYERFECR